MTDENFTELKQFRLELGFRETPSDINTELLNRNFTRTKQGVPLPNGEDIRIDTYDDGRFRICCTYGPVLSSLVEHAGGGIPFQMSINGCTNGESPHIDLAKSIADKYDALVFDARRKEVIRGWHTRTVEKERKSSKRFPFRDLPVNNY